jgi:glutathione S-transferase
MDPIKRNNDKVIEKFTLFNSKLALLERIIDEEGSGPFFMNENFSIAECVIPPTLIMTELMAEELGMKINFDENIKLKKWYERIKQHPCVSPVLEKSRVATLTWISKKKEGAISKCSL